MVPRWGKALSNLSKVLGSQNNIASRKPFSYMHRNYSVVAAATSPVLDSPIKDFSGKNEVNLNKMFYSKPCSLALPLDSPLRIEEPKYEGIRHIILKLMLFYSKQSKSIRGANVIYRRVVSQVDKPAIYNVFNLEKTFKTTFSLLNLHMWLCLRRLKEEGKEGGELGQYLYEIYNHDLELRTSKAGVNLLLIRWMKDLEKIFYGNVVAYDKALLPEAKRDELTNVIWRNVFSDDGSPMPDSASHVVQNPNYWSVQINASLDVTAQNVISENFLLDNHPVVESISFVEAMARYVRREFYCMSLTDKEAVFSGNFLFTPLENPLPDPLKKKS